MTPSVVILAAGRGERMRSALPKSLHPLGGRPLLEHVYSAAGKVAAADGIYIVHGAGGELLRQRCAHLRAQWVRQEPQLGTGHAVMQALPRLPEQALALILCGDVPLIREQTLQRLIAAADAGGLALLSAELTDPRGYGRLLRDGAGRLERIVEEQDADERQRRIREVFCGALAAPAASLRRWLAGVGKENAQGEYYLPGVVAAAAAEGAAPVAVAVPDPAEVQGVNTRAQLALLERRWQRRQAEAIMAAGVSLLDPSRFDLRGTLEAGRDVSIDVNAILEGRVRLGNDVRIGSNCRIRDSELGDGVQVLANSVIEEARIEARARLGPFCRIRPGTRVAAEARIGNFVELKEAAVGEATRIAHLSYIGDAELGARSNIGCGVVTCNYDGADKHRTEIGDDVFVGSQAQLIAPLRIGDGATIAAGTAVTEDVEKDALAIGRPRQETVRGWKRPGRD